MNPLEHEIAAFRANQAMLETEHMGEWVLIFKGKVEGFYRTFEDAGADAVRRFGIVPYLIRRIGAPPLTLPVSVMYHPDPRG